jgi:hypothetical protein
MLYSAAAPNPFNDATGGVKHRQAWVGMMAVCNALGHTSVDARYSQLLCVTGHSVSSTVVRRCDQRFPVIRNSTSGQAGEVQG